MAVKTLWFYLPVLMGFTATESGLLGSLLPLSITCRASLSFGLLVAALAELDRHPGCLLLAR